ncbi:hypothetical protein [Flexibacterium corallicola]|uniref:hypothetical protein n=1 Tax=Flexibacterium corallicola TaxID=3037259 RepID=UPI00286EFA70|nr:hypothetical protein [Pseudovibrio sp. M1P-2-3]
MSHAIYGVCGSAFQLPCRVCGNQDIVLGTPHVMKPDAALWPEFGYFGNTLALRLPVDGQESFESW